MQSVLLRRVAALEQQLFPLAGSLKDIRNFVLLEHSLALGTAVHGTPLIRALRTVVPGARIVAAASGFGLGVLQGSPDLERLIPMPSPMNDLRGAIRALQQAGISGREPSAVLQSTGNGRTRVTLAAMLSGGHTRVGFGLHPELSAAALVFDPRKSQIDNNLGIIRGLGHGAALEAALARDPNLAEPVVYPSASEFESIGALLGAEGIVVSAPIAVFITQTSLTQKKGWRPQRFRGVAEMLAKEFGAQIVFAGMAAEAAAIEALRSGLRVRSASVAGRTNLGELSALFGLADVALTLDTGPMHLARAMQSPMVVIAPAWSPPIEWLPLHNPKARVLKNMDLPAAPEGYVIDEVSVDEVNAALRELLAQYPPLHRARAAEAGAKHS